jgi:hypothetical protein
MAVILASKHHVLLSDLPKVINSRIPSHALSSRIHAAGVLYHTMARGNNGQRYF